MSKVVRIDNEVWTKLAELAEGFETPNAVIRRLLGLPPKQAVKEEEAAA